MESGHEWMTPAVIAHYVILAHPAGGLFMALGLLTRIAVLVQIPVLIRRRILRPLERRLICFGPEPRILDDDLVPLEPHPVSRRRSLVDRLCHGPKVE